MFALNGRLTAGFTVQVINCSRNFFMSVWILIFWKIRNDLTYVSSLSGAQWISGRVLDSRLRGCWFEPHLRHCIVSLSKTLYPLLSTGSIRKTRLDMTGKMLNGT